MSATLPCCSQNKTFKCQKVSYHHVKCFPRLLHISRLFVFLLSSYDFANSNLNDEFLNKMNPHHVPDVVSIGSIPFNGLGRIETGYGSFVSLSCTAPYWWAPLLQLVELVGITWEWEKNLCYTHAVGSNSTGRQHWILCWRNNVRACLFRFWLRRATTGQRE